MPSAGLPKITIVTPRFNSAVIIRETLKASATKITRMSSPH